MKEIVERLTENRQIERAKSILENNGYKVSKGLKESVGFEIWYDGNCIHDESNEEYADEEEAMEEAEYYIEDLLNHDDAYADDSRSDFEVRVV